MKLSFESNTKIQSIGLGVLLLAIRYEYIFLTIRILSGLQYAGNPSYGIDFSVLKDTISCVFYIFELVLLIKLKRKSFFRDNLMYIFFLLYIMPLNSVTSLVDAPVEFLLASSFFSIYLIVLMSLNKQDEKVLTENNVELNNSIDFFERFQNNKMVNILCFWVCVLFIIYKISFNGFYFPLNFLGGDVYTSRLENIELVRQNDSGIIGLFITVLTDITTFIAPLYLLLSIRNKRIIPIAAAGLCMLSQYAIYSMKTTMMLIPVIVFIALYKGRHKTEIKYLLSAFFFIGFAIMIVLWERFDEGRLYFILVRRMMYLPTWLNTVYFDFFSNHTKLFLTDEVFVLKKLLPHIYDRSVLKLISETYLSNEIASPNNGMFSEGFMQFGYLGLVAFPLLYKLLFDWTERVYTKYGKQIELFVCVLLIINLPNVGVLRSDFVMSFILMTIIIQVVGKVNLKRNVHN